MKPIPNGPEQEKIGFWRKVLRDLFYGRKLFWILTVLILVADLWTKDAAISVVQENQNRGEGQYYWVAEPWFALVAVTNKGGPWGLGRDYSEELRIIRILALGVILYLLMGTPRNRRFQEVSLAMVMGGALGNIWDSWKYGHVRDFLHFKLGFPPADPWPAFNLADSMICLGVCCLALSIILNSFSARQEAQKAPEEKVS